VEFPACIIHDYDADGKICGGAIYYEGHQLVDQTNKLEHMRGIPG